MRKPTKQDVGAAVFIVSIVVAAYSILYLLLFGLAIFLWEDTNMDPILENILISVFSSIVTTALSAVVTYKVFLEKLLKRHEERITDKLDPGGRYLHEEHAEIKGSIREKHAELEGALREQHKALREDYTALKSTLDAVNLRSAIDAERYKLLDVNQQAVVDAARRLDGMATAYQNAIAAAAQLSEDNRRLREQLRKVCMAAPQSTGPAWDEEPEIG